MRNTRHYAVLAYTGALPFVFCAALLVAGIDTVPVLGSVTLIAKTYSLAIVAFLCGVHWGTWQQVQNDGVPQLLLWSNALTLLIWFAVLLAPAPVALFAAAACFAILLGLDGRLRHLNVISDAYFSVRRNVSAAAIAALLVSAIFAAG